MTTVYHYIQKRAPNYKRGTSAVVGSGSRFLKYRADVIYFLKNLKFFVLILKCSTSLNDIFPLVRFPSKDSCSFSPLLFVHDYYYNTYVNGPTATDGRHTRVVQQIVKRV